MPYTSALPLAHFQTHAPVQSTMRPRNRTQPRVVTRLDPQKVAACLLRRSQWRVTGRHVPLLSSKLDILLRSQRMISTHLRFSPCSLCRPAPNMVIWYRISDMYAYYAYGILTHLVAVCTSRHVVQTSRCISTTTSCDAFGVPSGR